MLNNKKTFLTLIITLTLVFITLNSASAIDINNETEGGLKKAIDEIENSGKINLDEGFYSGLNNNNITIEDKEIIIIGKAGKTIIDGNGENTLFLIKKGAKLTLINVTIQNCYAESGGAIFNSGTLNIEGCKFENNVAEINGGAINNTNGSLFISNSIFINNSANNGGAISYDYGNGTISNSKFMNNVGITTAGAVSATSSNLTIKDSSFIKNSGRYSGAVSAGKDTNCSFFNLDFINNSATTNNGGTMGINYAKYMLISNCTFIGSTANSGGAIHESYSNVTILNSKFINNSASNMGGAIYNSASKNFHILNSIFINNSASNMGGAIYKYNMGQVTNTTISDSIFENNTAANSGGAIQNNGTMSIVNSKFTNNNAANGGAIYNVNGLTIFGSLFVNNTAGTSGGAIYNYKKGSELNDLIINYSVFSNNLDSDGKIIVNDGGVVLADYNFWGTNDITGLFTDFEVGNYYKMVFEIVNSPYYYLDVVTFSYKLINNVTGDNLGVENLPAFNITIWYNDILNTIIDGRESVEINISSNNLINNFKFKLFDEIINSTDITLNKASSKIELETEGDNKVGNIIKLIAKLKYKNGINGQIISFYVNGVKISDVITNADGIATLEYLLTNTSILNWYAAFEGSENFIESTSNTSSLHISKATPELELSYDDKLKQLIAKLSYNVGLNGQSIDFYHNGVFIGSSIIDNNGIAKLNYIINQPGSHSFNAIFNGDTNLLNTSTDLTFILQENNETNETNITNRSNENNETEQENETKGIEEFNNINEFEKQNDGSNNVVATASMKSTGIPLIALLIVFISCLIIPYRKK